MARRTTILAVLGAFIGLALTFCTLCAGKETASGTEEIFDFGPVSVGASCKHSFTIPNPGHRSLRFKNARTSSESVQVLAYPEEIPPRKKGQLQVRWFPDKVGPVMQEVILETEDEAASQLRYTLKATVEAKASPEATPPLQTKIPAELLTRKLRNHNPDLMISVASVQKKLKDQQLKQETLLIDVRDGKDFEKFRVPGSLNIPLYAVRTKKFLQHKTLILFNEGYSYTALERECRQLREAGFMAFILDGGLSQWKQKGGSLEGDALAQQELNKIPPSVFFEERNYAGWLLLSGSKARKTEADYLLPQAVVLTVPDRAERTAAQLKSVLERQEKNPFTTLLFFNDDGQGYEKTEKALKQAGITNVFYLKGGIQGYRNFLEQQAALLQARDDPKKTTRKCASCP